MIFRRYLLASSLTVFTHRCPNNEVFLSSARARLGSHPARAYGFTGGPDTQGSSLLERELTHPSAPRTRPNHASLSSRYTRGSTVLSRGPPHPEAHYACSGPPLCWQVRHEAEQVHPSPRSKQFPSLTPEEDFHILFKLQKVEKGPKAQKD